MEVASGTVLDEQRHAEAAGHASGSQKVTTQLEGRSPVILSIGGLDQVIAAALYSWL